MSAPARAALRRLVKDGRRPRPAHAGEAAELVAEARRQGMVGPLRLAADAEPAAWPADVRGNLADLHRAQLVRGVQQLDEAARAQQSLGRRGIRVLPLKGAALADELYAGAADRPMADVDLLVLDDFAAALAALGSEGYEVEETADHAVALRHLATGLRLEAHRSLASCPPLHPFDADAWWRRSRPGPEPLARRPSWEDLLVQLALHAAFQHGLVLSLAQYLDFRRILEAVPLDAGRLAQSASDSRAGLALGSALLAAEAVVGAPLAAPDRRLVDALPRAFRAWLEDRFREPLSFLTPAEPRLLRVRWALARGRRLRFVQASLGIDRAAPVGPGQVLRRGLRLARTWARPWGAHA
jgi:putative nucleotidyltransferase-like protein